MVPVGLRLVVNLPLTSTLLSQRIFVKIVSTRWFRSSSPLGMGRPSYDFQSICCSDNAIMVTTNDIKETHRPRSNEDVTEETHRPSWEKEEDRFFAHLDKEDVEWLLDHAAEYNAYQIGESFVLFMKGGNDIRVAPCLTVPAPVQGGSFVCCEIEEAPKGEEYTELFELACKFTPPGSKLSFAPGKYSFATTCSSMIEVKQLKRSDPSSSDGTIKDVNAAYENIYAPASVSLDFELLVGKGANTKTVGVNRALLFCFFRHLETMLGDALTDTKLELPELDPQAVKRVLKAFSTRKEVSMPFQHTEYVAFKEVQNAFGKSMIEMAKEKEPPSKKPRLEHPAIADPRWLDVSFLCGPQKEEIKVNRSVLASTNPVLHRILFGTGLISIDPSKPIEWPEFDAQAVRQVFMALLHCGKKEFVVPVESVESTKRLVDYLLETREALMLYYDTPFKREHQGSRFFFVSGRDGDGLKLSEQKDSTGFFRW
jgi:hypothetical protein